MLSDEKLNDYKRKHKYEHVRDCEYNYDHNQNHEYEQIRTKLIFAENESNNLKQSIAQFEQEIEKRYKNNTEQRRLDNKPEVIKIR